MEEKFQFLLKNQTWILIIALMYCKILQSKWTFRLKCRTKGEMTYYKVYWAVRGFKQEDSFDYHKIFATVMKPMSYKVLFAIA